MVSSINKDFVIETKSSTEPIPIRFCPVCNEKPKLPMIQRHKNYDYCYPACYEFVLKAVVRNNVRILRAIFGEKGFEL